VIATSAAPDLAASGEAAGAFDGMSIGD